MSTTSPIDRLLRLIDFPSSTTACWLWIGGKDRNGYGCFWMNRMRPAHAAAYELAIGPIPPGLEIDHLCRRPNCVNPIHLEAVTHGENVRRGWDYRPQTRAGAQQRAMCRRRHVLAEVGVYVRPADGASMCRACRREDIRKWRRALRGDT